MTSEEWLAAVREEAFDTVEMLSNARKPERERRTCAAFLRCAGIAFQPDQLIASTTEPPDVLFDAARFEVAIVLADDRRMHAEWRGRAERRKAAREIEDLFEPYEPPEILTRQLLIDEILPIATRKAEHYARSASGCAGLDLLVYVNQNVTFDIETPGPPLDNLARLGWRSVSILVPPHSYVVLAEAAAPRFLLERLGTPTSEWTELFCAGLFAI